MQDDVVARAGGVYLRPLREDDIGQRYLSWFRDPVVTAFLESANITRDDAIEHLRWGRDDGRRFMYAICLDGTGEHIGNVKIGDINEKLGTSDLVTVIGERNHWGKGFAAAAIRLGTDIAFSRLQLRKLHGGIYCENIGSLRAYTRAGWLVEAVLYKDVVGPAGPTDRVLVSCFNPRLYPSVPTFPLPLPR